MRDKNAVSHLDNSLPRSLISRRPVGFEPGSGRRNQLYSNFIFNIELLDFVLKMLSGYLITSVDNLSRYQFYYKISLNNCFVLFFANTFFNVVYEYRWQPPEAHQEFDFVP